MKHLESIIEDYRQGDFEARLSLFLQHRSLRNVFMEIDGRETEEKVPERLPAAHGPAILRLCRLFD